MKIVSLFKSILFQLKTQRLLTLVTVTGTALAIFLIMIVVMLQEVQTAPFAPESNRNRLLHYDYISVQFDNHMQNNCPMSWQFIKEVILPLESAETFTCIKYSVDNSVISEVGGKSATAKVRQTDHRFWDVFDFNFIAGKPFTADDFDTRRPVAVICESVAKALFGTTDAAGRDILINGIPYHVTGIVKDVSELAETAYAQVWSNVAKSTLYQDWTKLTGWMSAVILAKSESDIPVVKAEVEQRTDELNKLLEAEQRQIISRNRPYEQAKHVEQSSSNAEPDLEGANRLRYTVYLILLIVPAINLLSMTQSRLKKRTSEIAIRRAFGCPRNDIIRDLLLENLILTLIAGVIGLILCIGFAWGFDTYVFERIGDSRIRVSASLTELLHWSTFAMALLFCFILNLLSNSIPACRASRTSLTVAMSGRSK